MAFSPEGRFLLTCDLDGARLWDAPAVLPADISRLAAWIESATGLELDKRGSLHVLDHSSWLETRRRLGDLGGPPPVDRAQRLDPILFGPDPASRGDALAERGQWDQAEAAYAEAIRARPLNRSIREAFARFQASRGQLNEAAAALLDSVEVMPDHLELYHSLGTAQLSSGDFDGWRRASVRLLERFGATEVVWTAAQVAWFCVKSPHCATDPGAPVRLAESAVKNAEPLEKADALSTLGTALYREGRLEEARLRLDEAVQSRGGEGLPRDWAFLTLVHYRLGHREEARRWLERLQSYQPGAEPVQFFHELEIRLLRSEAEAVVIFDPAFPADPFAR